MHALLTARRVTNLRCIWQAQLNSHTMHLFGSKHPSYIYTSTVVCPDRVSYQPVYVVRAL